MRLRLLPQCTHVMVSPWRVAIAASVVRVVTTPVRQSGAWCRVRLAKCGVYPGKAGRHR